MKFPDILRHKNSNRAIVDSSDTLGGHHSVTSKIARNAIPLNKRKLRMLVSYLDGVQEVTKKFIGTDITDFYWTNDANWSDITSGTSTDTNAVHVNSANEINGIAEKVNVVDDDILLGEDSESTPTVFQKIKIKISSILNQAKDYADSLFSPDYQTLTSATSVTMDVEVSVNAKITLGHDVTLTLDNLVNGNEGNIEVIQGSTDYTLTLIPTPHVLNDGGSTIELLSGSGSITVISYSYDGTTLLVTYNKLSDLANSIHDATAETSILDADEVPFWKVVGTALRKITFANLKATLKAYFDGIYKIYTPTTQPVIDAGTMTLDCTNKEEAMFEGRTSAGTLTITDDFTIALSNATDAKLISLILTLTGTNVITFPNTVMCSNPSSKGTWANNVLTLASGTGVIVEFQLIWYVSASKWQLKVSEEGVI